jgi:hypothetical protein
MRNIEQVAKSVENKKVIMFGGANEKSIQGKLVP